MNPRDPTSFDDAKENPATPYGGEWPGAPAFPEATAGVATLGGTPTLQAPNGTGEGMPNGQWPHGAPPALLSPSSYAGPPSAPVSPGAPNGFPGAYPPSPPSLPAAAPYPGYAGPPSQGFPPGYAAPPSQGFPPGYAPYTPYAPPPVPKPKNRVAMIIGIVVGVTLVACIGGVAVLYAIGSAVKSSTASATMTASAQQSTSAQASPAATVLYQDALNTSSRGWANTQQCFLRSDGLHVRNNYICFAPAGTLTNVEVSVQVKQISGATVEPYGIIVRQTAQGSYYDFDIDSNGKAVIFKCPASATTCTRLMDYTPNPAIHSGLNISNALDVKAVGSHFVFSVNGTVVAQVDDASFASGTVALDAGQSMEAVYSNLKISTAS